MIHFIDPNTGRLACNSKREPRPTDSGTIRKVHCKNCLRALATRVRFGHVDVEREHHPSWDDDCAAFMQSLAHLDVSYEQAASVGEVFFGARPSEMDRPMRGRLLTGIAKKRGRAA